MEILTRLESLFAQAMAIREHFAVSLTNEGYLWIWRLVHYLTDVKTWILCIIPILVLQWLRPVREIDGKFWSSFAHDWTYPLFAISIASHLVVPVVGLIYNAGRWLRPDGCGQYASTWPPLAQYLLALVLQDFLRYWSHFARHRVKWLWYFHSIHHSQVNLNPATTHRSHPFEAFIGAIFFTLPIGLICIEPVAWVYAGITSVFWDLFIHSNVRTNLGFFGRIMASPQYHRIHHSALPRHFDKNFCDRFIIWDWIFGTMHKGRDEYPPTGCPESTELMEKEFTFARSFRSWCRQFFFPFRKILRIWDNWVA